METPELAWPIERGREYISHLLLKETARENREIEHRDNPAIDPLTRERRLSFQKLVRRRNNSVSGAFPLLPSTAIRPVREEQSPASWRARPTGSFENWAVPENAMSPTTERVEEFLEHCKRDALKDMQSEVQRGMAGMGSQYTIDNVSAEELAACEPQHEDHKKIGEMASTAICGNDITSSCFYVVGSISITAGIYAPICTVLSSFTLYCFRSVYGEVVMALPLNGGIYNLLLNTSSKQTASVAACLTILSYTATAVVSSVSAGDYLSCSPRFAGLEAVPTAVTILAFFALLMLMGMKESSVVALLLFVFHLSVLFTLASFSVLFVLDVGLAQFYANLKWPHQPPPLQSIFFGFSSAMLGVSGFETSANFVEEQKPGVFPKTLTNMWSSVTIINIVFPSLAACVMTMDELTGPQSGYSLAFLAERVAGPIMRDIVTIDALVCLAGAVLTSYVGVVGLFQRMSGDRCLPEFFSITNSWRGTPHYTISIFFFICASMCIILDGRIEKLEAIYSIAFLLVMGLFAFCGLWMKVSRPTLPRQIVSHPIKFIVGIIMVATAFTAVVLLQPDVLTYFYIYYGITVIVVMTTFVRQEILNMMFQFMTHSKWAKAFLRKIVEGDAAQMWMLAKLQSLRNQGVVYFTKHANVSELNRALQYIEQNEEARWVRLIHVYNKEEEIPAHLLEYVQLLDCVYPKIKLDCLLVRGDFGPAVVHAIAQRLSVPVNCMFMNCPQHHFKHRLDRLGGVRIILNSQKRSLLEGIQTMREAASDNYLEQCLSEATSSRKHSLHSHTRQISQSSEDEELPAL